MGQSGKYPRQALFTTKEQTEMTATINIIRDPFDVALEANKGDRRTGRTTKQMQAAPKGAIFVWCNGGTHYPKELAKKIGRPDLDVVALDALNDPMRFRGKQISAIVLDHATPLYMTEKQGQGLRQLLPLIGKGQPPQAKEPPPPPKPTITADVKSWDPVMGTGLTLRDAKAQRIGFIKVVSISHDGTPGDLREKSMLLVNRIAELINGEDHHRTAEILPQHR
jgi:hypothetical protein